VRVLALDTTTPCASVALLDASGVTEERSVSEAGHSGFVLPAVEALLASRGLEAAAVDLIAVTIGPGSFTGLRVGLGSAQGLALASGKPCVGVPTLDVLAHTARGAAPSLVALMNAFRGEVFCGVYDRDARPAAEPCVGPLASMLDALPPGSAFVGDAAGSERAAIEVAVPGAVFPGTGEFLAAELARMALEPGRAAVAARELRPIYLRGAHIRPARA
jgi:tRNA threonylcarbamoyl adenosine modification protein YeaZ